LSRSSAAGHISHCRRSFAISFEGAVDIRVSLQTKFSPHVYLSKLPSKSRLIRVDPPIGQLLVRWVDGPMISQYEKPSTDAISRNNKLFSNLLNRGPLG